MKSFASPIVALLPLWIGLTGCEGIHLYDATRHETAKRAAEAFKTADLPKSLDGEYAQLDLMLETELKATRSHKLAGRNNWLIGTLQQNVAADGTNRSKRLASLDEDIWNRICALLYDQTAAKQFQKAFKDWSEMEYEAFKELLAKAHNPINSAAGLIVAYRVDMKYQLLRYDHARRRGDAGDPSVEQVEKAAPNDDTIRNSLSGSDALNYYTAYSSSRIEYERQLAIVRGTEYASSSLAKITQQIAGLEQLRIDADAQAKELAGKIDELKKQIAKATKRKGHDAVTALVAAAMGYKSKMEDQAAATDDASRKAAAERVAAAKKAWEAAQAEAVAVGLKSTAEALQAEFKRMEEAGADMAKFKDAAKEVARLSEEALKDALKDEDLRALMLKLDLTLDELRKAAESVTPAGSLVDSFTSDDLQLGKRIALIDEQLSALHHLVQVASGASPMDPASLPKDAHASLRVALTIRAISEAVAQSRSQPAVSHLLLEMSRLELERAALVKRKSRGGEHIALLEQKREAVLDELKNLKQAFIAVQTVREMLTIPVHNDPARWRDPVLFDAIHMPPGSTVVNGRIERTPDGDMIRSRLFRALQFYTISWTTGQLRQEELDVRIVHLAHQMALDQSAASLAQWNNLVAVPLSRLVAFHGSGIPPQTIANLIHAAGLSAIAAGLY